MGRFVPKRAFFEPQALEYPLGRELYDKLQKMGVPVRMTGSHNRVTGIPGKTVKEGYLEAKRTLVVGIKKGMEFAPCKPSAHYQLPLNTSCPGMCEYCYLATTLGKKPYIRVYVNIDEILEKALGYIKEREPETTVFEGAATSDPIPTEYLTGLLAKTINFFGRQQYGRFRFVTKHVDIDTILTAEHNGHTRFRFSLNAEAVISRYEHGTPALPQRIAAAGKAARARFPLGFIIAPIFVFDNWQEEYENLFKLLKAELTSKSQENLTFELITHRFTARAKKNIFELYPKTTLPMEEAERKYKYGQFGYGKYVYEKDTMEKVKSFMEERLNYHFPDSKIEYFV